MSGDSSQSGNRRASGKASYPASFPRSRGRRNLDGDAGSKRDVGSKQGLNTSSNAKAALLAAVEVHSCLTKLENECKKSYEESLPTVSEWKISTKAEAAEEEECSEFTSMPSRSSSGMMEAISIKPNSPELDVNFDGNDLGFFGDVGVKSSRKLRGSFDESPMYAISEENIMPWDM